MRMTVFFSDVRGFTTISEKLEPQVLSKVLSDYLTPMTQIVFENKGTLDKYMGDAIMAFFGAPIHYDDHAKYACRCALQNIAKLKEIQLEFKKQGYPHIDIGIGINTGDMSAGNMGSDIVRSYTVMGDSVNLGSRLEGINKEYGTRIIISEYTYEDIKNDFSAREIDWVRVKGKYQPIRIFELLSEGAPPEEFQEMLEHYNKGFQLYHEKKFGEAIEIFNLALQAKPDDPVSQLYIERCQDYLAEPPPEKWDGVHIMKTK
jgi:adenylate cyclase